jgi:hypothetical protein
MDNKDNNIQFTKINKNTYNLEFTIKNDFIYIPKIIDFSLTDSKKLVLNF